MRPSLALGLLLAGLALPAAAVWLAPAAPAAAEQAAASAQVSDLPAPAYHHPRSFWRARHGLYTAWRLPEAAGAAARDLPLFEAAECRLCHQPRRFCLGCHRLVGAPGPPGERTHD